MNKTIITTNPNFGIQEELKVGEVIKPNKKSEELMIFFNEDNNIKKIAGEIASGKIRTTEELSSLASSIAITEIKKDYENYINQVKEGETGLLKFLLLKGKKIGKDQVEVKFSGFYKGLPDDFADLLGKFSTYKEYKIGDLVKVEDDDRKKYKITFMLGKDKKGNLLIQDFTIEEDEKI